MSKDRKKARILIVDPKEFRALGLMEKMEALSCTAELAGAAAEALDRAEQAYFDLVFLQWDLDFSESFLGDFLDLFPEIPVITAKSHFSKEEIVQAMRLGAYDALTLPLEEEALNEALEEALEYRRLSREQGERRKELRQRYDVENIVGQSRPMQSVFRLIHKVARTDATVLILGDSGTGKELVARAIHYHSPRAESPMVPVNCGAIPEDLLESELFGHEKGSFTGAHKARPGRFELAHGGTIFLDEIGDMSPLLQVKLLRVLQEHQIERVGGIRPINTDIRVLAATHQNLENRVKEGVFREDLFYRLNVVPITVPPLRERRSDIPLLCDHFLKRLGMRKELGHKKLDSKVMRMLLRYDWPGNVRELENLLERMAILAEGETITTQDLPPHLGGPEDNLPEASEYPAMESGLPEEGLDFNREVDRFERALILAALERTGWVKNQAAGLLKLNRTTLVEKIKKKKLSKPA